MITTLESTTTIDDCRWAIADYQAALPRARQALSRKLDAMLSQAIGERVLAEMRIDKRWKWCDHGEGHPLIEQRETETIETLHEYEQWHDVVREMCTALGKRGERCQ